MRNDLLRAVLDCGNDDLDLLDDAGADMYEIVEHIKENGIEITLTSLMEEVFRDGIQRLGEVVKEYWQTLESQEKSGKMTEIEYEQLRKLRDYDINPEEDFGFYVNFQDTHLYVMEDKRKVYDEIFEQELRDLENYTGFDIE